MIEGGIINWLSIWFNGIEFSKIGILNIKEWMNWAIFVDTKDTNKNDGTFRSKFINKYINKLYTVLSLNKISINETYTKDIKFGANTLRDIPLLYKPLIFYILIEVVQYITLFIFKYIYSFQYTYINGIRVWYHLSDKSIKNNNSNGINNKKKSQPFCMFHGLGIYYLPYLLFIHKLIRKTNNKKYDIIFIEVPWIILSLKHYIPFINTYLNMNKIPKTINDFISILNTIEIKILSKYYDTDIQKHSKYNGLKYKWTLYGHSYGTFIISGIYRYLKQYYNVENSKLPRLILTDPVSLCLSHPITVNAVCFKRDIITEILKWIVMNDMMISVCLNRYFHWFEYCIYPHELIIKRNDNINCINNGIVNRVNNSNNGNNNNNRNKQLNKHVIILSKYDSLVPVKLINNSINILNLNKSINYTILNGHHATWLVNSKQIDTVLNMIIAK